MNFEQELKGRVAEAEEAIAGYLPKEAGEVKRLAEAMNYSVLAGGKRLRPILMLESYRLFGGSGGVVKPFMAAMEMIHTYSLIHDDLPAMDNDLYRRGRKTTHAVFGEAMAILAGDGLLNLAYETAAEAFSFEADMVAVSRAFQVFAEKAGIHGMVGGQAVDVAAEKERISLGADGLLFVHANKTAALIQSCLMVGAILAGADEKSVNKLEKIGLDVGIAFQIQDDILDETSTLEELGKPIGSDKEQGKETYVTLFGMERALADVRKMTEEALTLLGGLPGENPFLSRLIESLITRRK